MSSIVFYFFEICTIPTFLILSNAGWNRADVSLAQMGKKDAQGNLCILLRIGQVRRKYNVTARLEVMAIIIRPFTYESDIQTCQGRKNQIKIENLLPVLTEEERMEQMRCIEEGLFEIFIKYAKQAEKSDRYLGVAAV